MVYHVIIMSSSVRTYNLGEVSYQPLREYGPDMSKLNEFLQGSMWLHVPSFSVREEHDFYIATMGFGKVEFTLTLLELKRKTNARSVMAGQVYWAIRKFSNPDAFIKGTDMVPVGACWDGEDIPVVVQQKPSACLAVARNVKLPSVEALRFYLSAHSRVAIDAEVVLSMLDEKRQLVVALGRSLKDVCLARSALGISPTSSSPLTNARVGVSPLCELVPDTDRDMWEIGFMDTFGAVFDRNPGGKCPSKSLEGYTSGSYFGVSCYMVGSPLCYDGNDLVAIVTSGGIVPDDRGDCAFVSLLENGLFYTPTKKLVCEDPGFEYRVGAVVTKHARALNSSPLCFGSVEQAIAFGPKIIFLMPVGGSVEHRSYLRSNHYYDYSHKCLMERTCGGATFLWDETFSTTFNFIVGWARNLV